MAKFTRNLATVCENFDRDALKTIAEMHEYEFGDEFGLDLHEFEQVKGYENYFYFKDNGSKVLAVAHLDTVVHEDQRMTEFVDTLDGLVVHSGALDDRLGAYIILDLLPKCGIQYDILLTVGEESGCSTAEYFDAPKEYEWIIEFDRGGMDVVLYEYEDDELRAKVRRTGAQVGVGIFSDISYMEHVGVKGINWGVAYHDYHSTRGYAYIDDTMEMVARYLKFHQQNYGMGQMPHTQKPMPDWWGSRGRKSSLSNMSENSNWWNDDPYDGKDPNDESNWVEGEDGIFRWAGDSLANTRSYSPNGILGDEYAEKCDVDTEPLGYPREALDDGYYSETVYSDDEYIENPTIEEIQAALEKADALAYDEWLAERAAG